MTWFWWFGLVCDLLIPLLMILFGWIMWKHCPSKLNRWYGYRTARSMQNMDTWRFAHAHFGRQWWRLGWILLVPTVLPLVLVRQEAEYTVAAVFLAVMVVQSALLVYPIFRTERALNENFDSEGRRSH